MTFQLPDRSAITTPLASLELVVLDTETTGLDVARDRVIELAAVRVRDGMVVEDETFSTFVNPGMPISRASTGVHGITDRDVANAPGFAEVVHDFAEWAGPHVIGGYMVGFDLAIMRAEHHRHGLRWQMPLALDVQALAQLVAPRLPDFSLETIAAWLQIAITARHRALADAVAAAHILVRLLPLLRERNIRTLAEAIRACEELQARRGAVGTGLPAAWELEKPQWRAAKTVDSYPFRHRAHEVMRREIATIGSHASVDAALQMMLKKQVSSLFVPPEEEGGEWGIITERDVLRAIAASGPSVLRHQVGQYASFPLVAVAENEFIYRVLARMAELRIRHMAVRSRVNDEIIGALTQGDLLRYRASQAVVFTERIGKAQTAEELAELWPMLLDVVRAMHADNAPPNDIAAVIGRELRALTARACTLALARMRESGRGEAPVTHGMLVLGSAGRGESLLAMDQDNAIIYADVPAERREEVDAWFAEYGAIVNDMLNAAGVPLCKGGVMAREAKWRKSRGQWLKTVEKWLSTAAPQDLLHVDIFFDMRRAFGDRDLVREFRRECLRRAKGARTLLKFLSLQASDFESPLGWFGRLKTDHEGRVDLKMGGLMPIQSAARVLALQLGSVKRATPARLRAAVKAGICPRPQAENLIQAHRILLGTVLAQQLRDIERGLPPSNRVATAELGAYERDELRWALEQVRSIPSLLGVPELRVT